MSYEVFVVDNASSDGSVEAVRGAYPETNIIANSVNAGFGRANNQALRRAKGEYYVLINSDARLTEGAIEAMLDAMDADARIAVVGGQLLNTDGSRQNSIDNTPSLATEMLSKSLLRKLFPEIYPSKYREYSAPCEVEQVIGACMMLRRKAVEAVGLFDEDYFFFMEETDWQLRFRKAGWKVMHQPKARIYHDQGKSANKRPAAARIEYYRSRYKFFKKHYWIVTRGLLRFGLLLKLIVGVVINFVAALLTFFMLKSVRRKLYMQAALLAWHLAMCPEGWGFQKKGSGT